MALKKIYSGENGLLISVTLSSASRRCECQNTVFNIDKRYFDVPTSIIV